MSASTRIVAISGSLRAGSYNTGLISAAMELAPDGVAIEAQEIGDLPLFGSVGLDPLPPPAARLADAIRQADGVLIASPEFNHGIPGPLKNALDWVSRPAYASVFAGKPAAILSASPSPVGGARAQAHLKIVLLGMAAAVYPAPEYLVGGASRAFDDGRLVDGKAIERLERFLRGFVDWTRRVATL